MKQANTSSLVPLPHQHASHCKNSPPMAKQLPRSEGEKEENPKTRQSEPFQHHQGVVGYIAIQLALWGWGECGPREALVVGLVSGGYRVLVGGIVDDVSTEQSANQKEYKDEEQHSNVGNNHILGFSQSGRHNNQFHHRQHEEEQPRQKAKPNRNEEEGEAPGIAISWSNETTNVWVRQKWLRASGKGNSIQSGPRFETHLPSGGWNEHKEERNAPANEVVQCNAGPSPHSFSCLQPASNKNLLCVYVCLLTINEWRWRRRNSYF